MTATAPHPRPRGAARRVALLEAVLRIVADVGPESVTHRRVAEVAGLPLASTTYWFESKEHLLTAALELAAERDMERLEQFAAAATGDPLEAAIDAIIGPTQDGSVAARSSLIATYTLLLEAARRPALREVSARWTEAYLTTLAPLLKAAGSRRPRADAELVLAAADGLLIEQLAIGAELHLRRRLRTLGRALVAGR